MTYLPLFLKVSARDADAGRILVIGGGNIAAAKVEALAGCGAAVDVIAKNPGTGVLDLCKKHGFSCHTAQYDPASLEGRKIVVAATNDPIVNETIAADCRARGIPVNVVDNPELCDFIFPALVRRGPLQIAISTSGMAPVLARMVKQTIETVIPVEFERLIRFMADKKAVIRRHLTDIQPRRLFSENIIRGPVSEEILEGNIARADALFAEALSDYPDVCHAALYLIGTGPGNPELVTLKAVRLLGRADIVLYDRLVSPALLDQYARKDAEKIFVGKTRCHHYKKQEDIDALIERYLRAGKIVARLKGGDPGIYAHGAEEIAIARRVGAPYQIVPGISAANGCAAYAGMPLTERDGAQAVRFLTLYKEQLHDAVFWESLRHAHGETLVFYMSSRHYGVLCRSLIEKSGLPATAPFAVIEQGTTPYHKEYAGTLGAFDADYGTHNFASPCLMIVGDVVRWRNACSWKESPVEDGSYFPDLPAREKAHA